jgi:hypothetical protein
MTKFEMKAERANIQRRGSIARAWIGADRQVSPTNAFELQQRVQNSNQHGFAHGAGGGNGNFFSGLTQFLNLFADEGAELVKSFFFGVAVAYASPRKQVGAMADVAMVVFAPQDKFKITVFGFHLVTSRMALRTCFFDTTGKRQRQLCGSSGNGRNWTQWLILTFGLQPRMDTN